MEFLDEAPEPDDTDLPELPPLRGEIRFNTVEFQYLNGPPLLSGLNLHIAAGETVAITGPNGSGKTTMAHLLMRFADPKAGDITIDGYPLKEYSLQSLRSQIGLVAQQTLLLNGSVRDNILYGRARADESSVEQAAMQAHAHEFISELQNGYDTIIGEQGIRLSGGQRQRLALARAMLINPPILILDEATAMFDPDGENAFIEDCRDLLAEKTVLLITHRPASLALADRVIDMTKERRMR
jgi:ABC-type multidrug transport system fused ATPase/permease subunit